MANDEFDNNIADKQAYDEFVAICKICKHPKSDNLHQPCDDFCDDDCLCHTFVEDLL